MTVMHELAGIDKPKVAICWYCGKEIWASNKDNPHTWDHVVPLARGGLNIRANMVSACFKCNTTKGVLTVEEFRTLKTLQHLSTRVLPFRVLRYKFAGERMKDARYREKLTRMANNGNINL